MISSYCHICLEGFKPGERVTTVVVQGEEQVWLCQSCAGEMREEYRRRGFSYGDIDLDRKGSVSGGREVPSSGNRAQRRARK